MAPQIITTVVTPASADAKKFIDLATVKSVLKITDASEDVFLNLQIGWVCGAIVQYCNRNLAVEQVKDEFWLQREPYPWMLPGGVMPLQLTRWPIIANGVAAITEDGTALVDGTDYRVDYDAGQLSRLDVNLWPRRWPTLPISVTYSAGYSPMEPSIVDAAMRMITARRATRARDPYLKQESIPGVRESQWWIATGTDAGNMTPDVVDILDNYRVPVTV